MKKAFLLYGLLGAALLIGSCTNQGTTARRNPATDYRGLVNAGSVSPVSGGPAGPRPARQRTQP